MKHAFKCFILLMALVCIAINSFGAQDNNGGKWDILGLSIGCSSSSVAKVLEDSIGSIKIEEKRGSVESGAFKSQPILFGANVQSNALDDPGAGTITIVYDPANSEIIAIKRVCMFDIDNRPTLEAVSNSLREKYGNPDIVANPAVMNRYLFWFRNASLNDSKKIEMFKSSATRTIEMSDGLFGYADQINSACGTMLMALIGHDPSRADTVGDVSYYLVDTVRARNSFQYIQKLVADGVGSSDAQRKAKGDKVKLRF
jgi:hypothetical protein